MKRIMLVGGEGDFVGSMKSTLEKMGNEVKTFLHPNDAAKNILDWKPSVVVTDIFMPFAEPIDQGMDGFTLCEIIRAIFPYSSAIIVSSMTEEDIEKVYPGKLVDCSFFKKPLSSIFYNEVAKNLHDNEKIESVNIQLTERDCVVLDSLKGDTLEQKVYKLIKKVVKIGCCIMKSDDQSV